MKTKIYRGLLIAEATACVLLCFLKVSITDLFTASMAFPFTHIGAGLRVLSLSGWLGNVLAITLYLLICLLPAGLLLILRKRRKLLMEDGLLALISIVLFFVMYLMVNPGIIKTIMGISGNSPVGQAILGGVIYSLIVAYLILRILRLFFAGNIEKLAGYFTITLGALSAVLVLIAFGACLQDTFSSIASLQAGNVGNEHLLGTTYGFLVLQYFVNALPYILDILIIFAAMRLLAELRIERYAAASVTAAERMSRLCAIALAATVLTNVLYTLLQLLFAKSLMVVNQSVQIPVLSILFVLAALLLTRFMIESKQLKDENDQFV